MLSNAPINKTLRPCRSESVGKDGIPGGFDSENLYIEGDNLEVLKLLQETYLGKIKMIYIDPPYNTGNDFVYNDDFAQSMEDYKNNSGQYDDEGNRLFQNTESNGRFHTDWLNMMYPRLRLARDLLSDDGAIFISIDDNEQASLKLICDEIFGGNNFVAQIIWERAFSPVNLKKHFSESHEYIVCYAKNKDVCICNGLPRDTESDDRYSNPDNDKRGLWTSGDLSVGPAVENKIYEIVTPSGKKCLPSKGRCWVYTKDRFEEMVKDNRIWFGEHGDNFPRIKRFLSEVKQRITPMTVWKYTEIGHTQDASQNLKKLFDGKAFFEYPKSVDLIKRCLQLYTSQDSIILDFFSGSATTAHAVMQLNAEDGGNRKFIMVQLPEKTDEKSEAYKAGYKNICEIGKERIRRSGKKIKNENSQQKLINDETHPELDIGFRVLKCDTSNMKDVYYKPSEYLQVNLDGMADNIKDDRTPEDLLFQSMLDLGITLSSKIEEKEIAGKRVFFVNNGKLIACFDDNVSIEAITEIAKRESKPDDNTVILRRSKLKNDCVLENFEQIFKTYSPHTKRRMI